MIKISPSTQLKQRYTIIKSVNKPYQKVEMRGKQQAELEAFYYGQDEQVNVPVIVHATNSKYITNLKQ